MRFTGDDWTTVDDPDYAGVEAAHRVEVHVAGIRCKCLPFLSIVPGAKADGSAGVALGHGHSWPARARVAERGHP